MYEKNSRIHLDGLQNKHRDCNRNKYNSSFGQNIGLRKKLDTTCPQNASSQITENNKKTTHRKAEETRENRGRDFWMCEIGTGPQVAQLHDDDGDDCGDGVGGGGSDELSLQTN